jgi:hypothetical protein
VRTGAISTDAVAAATASAILVFMRLWSPCWSVPAALGPSVGMRRDVGEWWWS